MIEDRLRTLLRQTAKLDRAATLSVRENLFDAGMTSFACVQLMLGIEEAFDIEFPDSLLARATFETIANIKETIGKLQA